MIGILGAMAVEVDEIKASLTGAVTDTFGGMTFARGTLEGVPVVVTQCGIGKVNAAVCSQRLIDAYQPDLMINLGVGGSLTDALRYCDIAVASRVVQHDVDTTALGDPIGLVSTVNRVYFDCDPAAVAQLKEAIDAEEGTRCAVGVIATGDQFISSAETKTLIVSRFGAICCDMESGAIAQTCLINGVPFAAVRAISDNADDASLVDYPQFMRVAAAHSCAVISRFLRLRTA